MVSLRLSNQQTTMPPPPEQLFHYTTADFARECQQDMDAGESIMAEIWMGTYGPGFYALDLDPNADRAQLLYECFGDARDHPMDGVLILDPAAAPTPFRHEELHRWRMPGDEGSPEPIDGMITAIGTWDGKAWQIADYE